MPQNDYLALARSEFGRHYRSVIGLSSAAGKE
jgi:hypothetical protein